MSTLAKRTRKKIDNPNREFAKPLDVVGDPEMSHDEKKKALDTYEQDARQLLTASNEGMAPEPGALVDEPQLDEVADAKRKIGEKPQHKSAH